MKKQFDLHKLIKEEMAKLNEAKQTIRLDDLTFDTLRAAFPDKYQKAYTTRQGLGGEQEDMYKDDQSVAFPKLSSRQVIISNSALEDWKEDFRKRYGNVKIVLDPQASEWFNFVTIDDAKFKKDKQERDNRMSSLMREDSSNKKHIKALMEARLEQVNLIKEGVMAELDIIMDEASDFKDFLKRINRDSRLETSLLNSPDMIKFFTKIWKESGRSL